MRPSAPPAARVLLKMQERSRLAANKGSSLPHLAQFNLSGGAAQVGRPRQGGFLRLE